MQSPEELMRQFREMQDDLNTIKLEKQKVEEEFSKYRAETAEKIKLLASDGRDLFFAHILSGGYYETQQDLIEDGEKFGVMLPYQLYIVIIFAPTQWGELYNDGQLNHKDINFILRNTMQNAFPGVTNAAEIKGNVAAIVNIDQLPEAGMKEIIEDVTMAIEMLDSEFGITVTGAVSRVYNDPMFLPSAMEDAELVLEYIDLVGEDTPAADYDSLTYGKMQPSHTSYIDLESRLLDFTRYGDVSGMRNTLHELISNEFSQTMPTIQIFRCRLYGITNTLLYLMNDLRDIVGSDVINKLDPGPKLAAAHSLAEIVEVIDEIMDGLDNHINQQKESASYAWVDDIRLYVQKNFRSVDLTAASVAEHFGFTPTYCSKKFRDRYGIRLFDFIQQQRLDEARNQLCTLKNMDQIADLAGFSSALTMSRAFKRYEGVAPSVIREKLLRLK